MCFLAETKAPALWQLTKSAAIAVGSTALAKYRPSAGAAEFTRAGYRAILVRIRSQLADLNPSATDEFLIYRIRKSRNGHIQQRVDIHREQWRRIKVKSDQGRTARLQI